MDPTSVGIVTAGSLVLLGSFGVYFNKEIRTLFPRIRGIGKDGVDLSDSQPKVQENPALDVAVPLEKQLDAMAVSPLQIQREQNIYTELAKRNLAQDSDKVKLLVRALAGVGLNAEFERMATAIYGTQLQLMVVVNGSNDGMKLAEVKEWYLGKVQPQNEDLQGVPFDIYFGYLTRNSLVAVNGENVHVTGYGNEFMQYLVRTRQTRTRSN
jgi:hypothetical protein